jgi:hypothetical protein
VTLGQFGSSSDSARSSASYTNVALGGSLGDAEKFRVFADLTYTIADEELDQLYFPADPAILARLKFSTYDFSTVHEFTRLESTSYDLEIGAEFKLYHDLHGVARYELHDYNDDAVYLSDLSGTLNVYSVGLAWRF